jgi:hypothetical protein
MAIECAFETAALVEPRIRPSPFGSVDLIAA